jgi:hypothetical protein
VLLQPGEDLTSERIIRRLWPLRDLVPALYLRQNTPIWWGATAAHCALSGKHTPPWSRPPPSHRHLRIHAGHCTYLLPEEAQCVTPALIRATCLAGRPEEVRERIHQLAQEGLHQLMLLPAYEVQYRMVEDFARLVMAKL